MRRLRIDHAADQPVSVCVIFTNFARVGEGDRVRTVAFSFSHRLPQFVPSVETCTE
jgi:hypothetical protein